LLDVLVHPQYSQHDWIYFSYARTGGFYTLSRAKISGNALSNIQQLYTTTEASSWRGHYGSRMVIDKNRFLFFSVGDPAAFGQNTGSGWGKVHRIHDDGRIPSDNPVLPGQTAANTIWAYGVRNPQGLAFHPVTGELWESEHGPRGGDEVNIIKKGANYGWPLVSHGRNYDGSIISSNPFMTGVENAIKVWTPSIAPCGMDFLKHKNWKAYRNRLVVGALAFRHVANVKFNGTSPVDEFRWLDQLGRVRNVKEGPDGSLYVSVEGPGRIIRITPQ
jgi:glucose/arabinose dehydrogenase